MVILDYSNTADNYGSTDIQNIIFEDINDKFAWGDYGGFRVIIMKKNGFINASQLAKDAGKNWLTGWLQEVRKIF